MRSEVPSRGELSNVDEGRRKGEVASETGESDEEKEGDRLRDAYADSLEEWDWDGEGEKSGCDGGGERDDGGNDDSASGC